MCGSDSVCRWTAVYRAILSVVGVLSVSVGGWLGAEMVYVKSMAVEAVNEMSKKVEKSSRARAA